MNPPLLHSQNKGFVLGLATTMSLMLTPRPFAAVNHEEIRDLARQGQVDSALQLSHRALDEDGKDIKALFLLAKLTPEGKVSADYFHQVLKLANKGPEVEESTFRLGQYYYATGKYYRSIPFFREYLSKFPTGEWQAPTLYWMGNACLAFAQSIAEKSAYFDSSLLYFKRLSSGQTREEYYWPLGLEGQAKIHMALGNRAEATASVDSALAKAPDEEQAALILLAAQLQQGSSREQEKRLLSQLLTRYPNSPEVRYLRKINPGVDPGSWKPGSGFPKKILTRTDTKTDIKAAENLFTLQLGAFSQAVNAKTMIENLTRLGFSPELVENQRNGKPIFQVRLGRFPTPKEASEYALQNLKPHKLLSQPVSIIPP